MAPETSTFSSLSKFVTGTEREVKTMYARDLERKGRKKKRERERKRVREREQTRERERMKERERERERVREIDR